MCGSLCGCCTALCSCCTKCCPSISTLSPCCKCECKWCNPEPETYDFYNSQWQKVPRVRLWYLIYRAVICALIFIIFFISIGLWKGSFLWLIYYVHWTLLVCIFQSVLALAITGWAFKRQDKTKSNEENTIIIPCFCSYVYWEVYLIGLNQTILISIMYWAITYASADKDQVSGKSLVAAVLVHALTAIIMLVDLFVVRFPIRMWASIWSLLFYVAYVIFIIIFHFSGAAEKYDQTDVSYSYKIFDWKESPVWAAVMILVGLIGGILVHLITFGFYMLRKFIYKAVVLPTQGNEMDEPKPEAATAETPDNKANKSKENA